MKKSLLFIIMFCLFINVKAYENDFFSIDIPKSFELTNDVNNTYVWVKKNSDYLSISVVNNTDNYNFDKFDTTELVNHELFVENEYNDFFKDYNITVNIQNVTKKNYGENYLVTYNLFIPSNKTIGYDMYQKSNIYSTKNYIVHLTYSCKDKFDLNTYNSIVNKFNIKDEKIKPFSFSQLLSYICSLTIVIILIKSIVSYLKRHFL